MTGIYKSADLSLVSVERLMVVAMCLITAVSYAADPQPYDINLDKTGNARLDQMLRDASILISLQESAKVGPFALIARSKQDQERFLVALHSLGFYKGKVSLRIAGSTLDDPELFDKLNDAPADPPVKVTAAFELGPQFHLGQIKIEGDISRRDRDALKLKTGDIALADEVLAARENLLNVLRERGHALAKVDEPVATLREDTDRVDILLHVDSGPKVIVGDIAVNGLKDMNEAFVRRLLLLSPGQMFQPSAIETARQDLSSLGVFSSVSAQTGKQLDAEGRIPVNFDVVERQRRAVNLGAAYSTDLGASFSGAWLHRNLFGNAEQLNLSAAVMQLGGNSATGIGYKGGADFSKPDFLRRDQSLQIGLDAIKQSLDAYDMKAVQAELLLNRKLSKKWHGSYGIAAQQSRITQEGVTRDYTLLSLPLTLKFDSSNSPLEPTEGSIATFSVTPTASLAGGGKPFVTMQVSGSTYLDLGKPGRSVLALRGLIGDTEGASQFELPPDRRFYAGGSATVRGYKYQSIGPAFADHKPQGGTAIAAGTVEFRQRILDDYGVALFTDVGQVSADSSPFSGSWQFGAGVGLRYYTSFGPIRLDLAFPVNPQPGSGSFEVYIGLGQSF